MFLLFSRVKNALFPALLLGIIFCKGFLTALKRQLSSPSLFALLSPRQWWTLIFATGFPAVLGDADKEWASVKRKLLSHASGSVLEIGPGAGHTIAYYDPEKVSKIVGIEPYVPLHVHTRAAIERAKLTDKYELVAASIEDSSILSEHGVLLGSIDTIICVQVLCSIPNPKRVIAEMYKFLKPGGQLILFEHVRSHDFITHILQNIWTYSIWNALTGKSHQSYTQYLMFMIDAGCNLNRPSEEWLRQVGEWSYIDLSPGPQETNADILPHAIGRLVKA
jgi:SAM-dependent methyltransferase